MDDEPETIDATKAVSLLRRAALKLERLGEAATPGPWELIACSDLYPYWILGQPPRGDTITLAATDRYRLAVRELTWEPAQPGLQAVAMIPGRTLAYIAKALGGTGAEVEIALSSGGTGEGMIGFSSAGRRTTIRLLDPEFPKFRSLLPTEFSARADLPTGAFVEAVKRVALVAERNTPVRLAFRGGEVVLEAGSGDEAQAVEVLPAEFHGDEINIAFNHQYLLEGLGAIDSDVVRLQFTTATKPAIVTPGKDGGEADYRHLIMPVRLSAGG